MSNTKIAAHIAPVAHNTVGNILSTIIIAGAASVIAFLTARSAYLTGQPLYKAAFIGVALFIFIAIAVLIIGVAVYFMRRRSLAETPGWKEGKTALDPHEACQKTIGNLESEVRNKAARLVALDSEKDNLRRDKGVLQSAFNETEWLRKIADDQAKDIQNCIETHWTIGLHKLTGAGSYIEFLFAVVNHSVYPISLNDNLQGSISFAQVRLTHPPTLADNRVKELPVNQTAYVTLHQQLTEGEAAHVLSEQGQFSLHGVTASVSAKGLTRLAQLDWGGCAPSINNQFINDNYRKLFIVIEAMPLQTYWGYVEKLGVELPWPEHQLGTILNLKVTIKNYRPLTVHEFKLFTSGPVVSAQKGELETKPFRSVSGRHNLKGHELYPNLADVEVIVERDNLIEGWLQFIVRDVLPEQMLNPANFVVRLHVVDRSTEIHMQDVVGLRLED